MLCPLCRSEKIRCLKSIDVELVVALWAKFYKIDIRPEFRNISQIELWQCASCSISFFAPESLAGSAEMYAQLEGTGGWGYYLSDKWEYEVAIKDLRGHKKILEVGCGSGNFISRAEEAGLSIVGLEQNPKAIAEAVARGLQVWKGSVEDVARDSPCSYDAVCSFQVIEHVPKAGEFLDACCAMLRPGGLLILAMPNQRSYVRHMVNPLDMPPHHMSRLTRKSLLCLEAFFPLRRLLTEYEPLTDLQVDLWSDTYRDALKRRHLGFFYPPWVQRWTIRAIRRLRLGRFLRGQNMYASYVRS